MAFSINYCSLQYPITPSVENESPNQMTNWCFSYILRETGLAISCTLSPKETICMKCQILFSGKNKKKDFEMVYAEFFTQY